MTQSNLAETLNVSTSYISQIECGKAEVSLKRLDEIAGIINTKTQHLVADSNDADDDFLISEIIEKLKDWYPENKRHLSRIIDTFDCHDINKTATD